MNIKDNTSPVGGSSQVLGERVVLAARAAELDNGEDAQMLGSPSLKPGAAFMVDMDSALRHAEAFDNGQVATSIVRELVLRHQSIAERPAVCASHTLTDAQVIAIKEAQKFAWASGMDVLHASLGSIIGIPEKAAGATNE